MNDYINEVISFLSCASNKIDDSHLCREPLVLSCGHHICKSCCKQETNYKTITCNICNKTNNRDLHQEQSRQMFELLVKSNLNKLFNVIFDKFKRSLKTCKDIMAGNDSVIENRIKFIKDEIMIKIESMKIELDNYYESFSKQLDEIKETWKSESNTFHLNKIDCGEFESIFNSLQENMKKYENLTKDDLYFYDTKLKNLQKFIIDYQNTRPIFEFNDANKNLTKDFIGELVFQSEADTILNKNIECNNYEKFKLEHEIVYAEVLPNGNLLMSTDTNLHNLILYDNNMNYVKTIAKINNKRVFPKAFITDGNNCIFFTNPSQRNIIKTDLDFNQLALYDDHTGWKCLIFPIGICYYEGNVFVCDSKRVHKLNSNLVYQASYQVDYNPWHIKNINNVALVRANDQSSIYFYDLDTFSLLRKYDGHNGIIGVSLTKFYEFTLKNKTFYIYNKNGELLKTVQTNGLDLSAPICNGSLCLFQSRLLINSWFEKFLILF